jgi:CheY-like chemotaxis protein
VPTQQHTVLIVDDEPSVRSMLADVLRGEGYRVLSAAHGRDALVTLRRGARPCLILLDMLMPEMDGWQFAAELRADPNLASIPFAAIGANPRYAADAPRIGARRWLGKPIDLQALFTTVEELCGAEAS